MLDASRSRVSNGQTRFQLILIHCVAGNLKSGLAEKSNFATLTSVKKRFVTNLSGINELRLRKVVPGRRGLPSCYMVVIYHYDISLNTGDKKNARAKRNDLFHSQGTFHCVRAAGTLLLLLFSIQCLKHALIYRESPSVA